MLRWSIVVLLLANLVAFAALRGVLGPWPEQLAREHEPRYLNRQVNPDALQYHRETAEEAANRAIVGAPAPSTPVHTVTLPGSR